MKIAQQLNQVQPPPITEVKSWIAGRTYSNDRPLVDLCQAVPSYPPAPELVDHLRQALQEPATYTYSPDEGLAEVRIEVSDWYRRRYGRGPDSGEICLTIGASQAFWLAMCCLCRPGDEVIIQLPAYFDHIMGLQSFRIRPVFAPFDPESGGQPDTRAIADLITDKTRAILLVTPSNPTGAVINTAQIDALFDLAKSRDVALMLDETYNAFAPDRPHELFNRQDWQDHFVHIASFGKTFALTGLRCGALIGSEKLLQQAIKIQDSMVVCQPRPTQLALAYGCHHLDSWVTANAVMMQRRHDCFREQFLAADLPFRMAASGSFFAWIEHPWGNLSGREAARKLADEADLICLPGEAFGPGLESYLRLAFGNIDVEKIPEAISRFAEFRSD